MMRLTYFHGDVCWTRDALTTPANTIRDFQNLTQNLRLPDDVWNKRIGTVYNSELAWTNEQAKFGYMLTGVGYKGL